MREKRYFPPHVSTLYQMVEHHSDVLQKYVLVITSLCRLPPGFKKKDTELWPSSVRNLKITLLDILSKEQVRDMD